MFQFKSVVRLLIKALSSTFDDHFYVHKAGINLLQSIICAVNINRKAEIGDAGAVTVIKTL